MLKPNCQSLSSQHGAFKQTLINLVKRQIILFLGVSVMRKENNGIIAHCALYTRRRLGDG
jgi:hypothetical protein